MIPGRTYVVWGVYSTEENARRAVAEARARLSDTNFRIYFFGRSGWFPFSKAILLRSAVTL